MKILIVNTSERNGGAAVAANRLYQGLLKNGIDVTMLVCEKQSDDSRVVCLPGKLRLRMDFLLERALIFFNNHFSRKKLFLVSAANTGYDITKLNVFKEADIIHLHWINQGMLSIKSLQAIKQSGKPVVWTMHDMWPLTGICHYAYECERYTEGCGQCPFLNSSNRKDLSNRVYLKKKTLFDQWQVSLVAVSSWLANLGSRSAVLKEHSIKVIPNAIPLDLFKPIDKEKAKKQLNLPMDKTLLVFGAASIGYPIKGFSFVKEALTLLGKKMDKASLHLVLYGGIKPGQEFLLTDIPTSYTWLGKVTKETLPIIFSACDVLVSPSYYETFGQTLIEAQSCGCIPICFGNSGQTDIIEDGITGLFAEFLSVESLADKLYEALTVFNRDVFVEKASQSVKSNYSDYKVASQYVEVYQSLLTERERL